MFFLDKPFHIIVKSKDLRWKKKTIKKPPKNIKNKETHDTSNLPVQTLYSN
jgi:hypothetical protein